MPKKPDMPKKPESNVETQSTPEPEQQPEVKFVKADNFRNIYANNVQISSSFMDVVMMFGQIVGLEGGILESENQARVVMSPQEAKLFTILLVQQIAAYERQFGAVKLPPNMLQPNVKNDPSVAPLLP